MPLPRRPAPRTLQLSDEEGLRAALANGEVCKVDCAEFVAAQTRTLSMAALSSMDLELNGHQVAFSWSGSWPRVQLSCKRIRACEAVAALPNVFASRPRMWGSLGRTSWGLLGYAWQWLMFVWVLLSGRANRILAHYAVVNVAELVTRGLCVRVPIPFTAAWRVIHSFAWVGSSAGGLHFDEMDNILIQLEGRKDVLVYPPELTDAISGEHYPPDLDDWLFTLSERNLSRKPLLADGGSIVSLSPGEGLLLPSGAYHSPSAATADSLSLNTFLFDGPPPSAHHKMSAWLRRWLLALADETEPVIHVGSNYEMHSGRGDGSPGAKRLSGGELWERFGCSGWGVGGGTSDKG